MQVPGLVVLRVCSSDRTAVFAGVREQIVHLLFTASVGQPRGGHSTPQVTDLYSGLLLGGIPDKFYCALVEVVTFPRDARGLVTGLAVHTTGVRSLRFDRINLSPFAPID